MGRRGLERHPLPARQRCALDTCNSHRRRKNARFVSDGWKALRLAHERRRWAQDSHDVFGLGGNFWRYRVALVGPGIQEERHRNQLRRGLARPEVPQYASLYVGKNERLAAD